jgi:hypothetical protein
MLKTTTKIKSNLNLFTDIVLIFYLPFVTRQLDLPHFQVLCEVFVSGNFMNMNSTDAS